MQAVILAGGLGTRLKPLTEQTPKVMVSVDGKPFLLYLFELLRNEGIYDIILCIGYLGKQVKDFFGDGQRFGIRIRYSEEKERLLGTGGALKQAQKMLDNHFFVLNGDTYLPIKYRKVEDSFIKCDKKVLMVVYDNKEDTSVKNNVELDNDLVVMKYDKEKLDPSLKYVEAGVLVLSQGVLGLMEDGCSVSLERGLYSTLIQQRELAAFVTQQRFYDVGTPKQLRTFEEFLKRE